MLLHWRESCVGPDLSASGAGPYRKLQLVSGSRNCGYVPANLVKPFAFELHRVLPDETHDVAGPMCLAGFMENDRFGDGVKIDGLDLQLVAKIGMAFKLHLVAIE